VVFGVEACKKLQQYVPTFSPGMRCYTVINTLLFHFLREDSDHFGYGDYGYYGGYNTVDTTFAAPVTTTTITTTI